MDMDRTMESSWHVVVGEQFTSAVTFEVAHCCATFLWWATNYVWGGYPIICFIFVFSSLLLLLNSSLLRPSPLRWLFQICFYHFHFCCCFSSFCCSYHCSWAVVNFYPRIWGVLLKEFVQYDFTHRRGFWALHKFTPFPAQNSDKFFTLK